MSLRTRMYESIFYATQRESDEESARLAFNEPPLVFRYIYRAYYNQLHPSLKAQKYSLFLWLAAHVLLG